MNIKMQKNHIEHTKNKDNLNSEVNEYSLMRVIAIILVVIGHSAYLKMGGVDYSSILGDIKLTQVSQIDEYIVGVIYKFHMPLFFAISGAVYYLQSVRRNRYTTLDELIFSKSRRLLIPYLLAGMFFVIPIKFISHYYSIDYLSNAIFYEMLQGIGHLWFLLALFWIFICFYILERYIFPRNKYIFYMIIFGTYFFSDFFDIIGIPGLVKNYNYLLFFYLGYFFESIREKYKRYALKFPIIFTCVLIILEEFSYNLKISVTFSYLVLLLQLIVQISLILATYNISFLLLKYSRISFSKLYNILRKYSFDIYIFHDPLNYLFLYFVSGFIITILRKHISESEGIAFFVIVILRILCNIIVSIGICIIAGKLKQHIRSKKKILYISGMIFMLAFGNVVYNKYNNIKVTNKIYSPEILSLANLTDDTWTNGVSNGDRILLIPNNGFSRDSVKNGKKIKSNDVIKRIKNIKIIDNLWIHIELEDRDGIENFQYPNAIDVIK